MMSDSNPTLLSDFVRNRSERAFCEIVSHHMPLVYSTALRRTNHASGFAQEVAQDVFTRLSQKAESLPKDICLSAWLYRQTCRIAANSVRTETRRKNRETIATELMNTAASPSKNELAEELDEAMLKLPGASREALILRYFDGENHQAVGKRLGVSEEAARKRVDRALESLRGILTQRGLRVSAPALVAVLTGLNTKTLPASTTAQISSEALNSPALKVSLSVTLAGLVVGVLSVSAIAGGIQMMGASTALRESNADQPSQRTRASSHSEKEDDLLTRIMKVCDSPGNIVGETRLFALLDEIEDGEIPEFVESSSVLLDRAARELCYNYLMRRWLKSDPLSAVNFALHSQVSLLVKYESVLQHQGGPDTGFLSSLALIWRSENSDDFSRWYSENQETVERLHGSQVCDRISRTILLGHESVAERIDYISRSAPHRQEYLLRQLFPSFGKADMEPADFLSLNQYLSQLDDPLLQEELEKRLWTSWASENSAEMLSHLREMEGEAAWQARLALLGRVHPKVVKARYAGGGGVRLGAGEPYATLEEREQDARDAGLALGLSEKEISRDILRWQAIHTPANPGGKLHQKIGNLQGVDDILEESIRARFSLEQNEFTLYLETLRMALMMEDEGRRRELARAIFRDALEADSAPRTLLVNVDKLDPVFPELEEMLNQKQ